MQELKGKILLKAKKIGGLEKCVDETLADEVSDDEDVANGETELSENRPAECQKVSVTNQHCLVFGELGSSAWFLLISAICCPLL